MGGQGFGQLGGDVLGEAFGGGVVDWEGGYVAFGEAVGGVVAVLDLVVGAVVLDGEGFGGHLEEEFVVEGFADLAGEALEEGEVDDPGFGGEAALDFDEDVVVVAVDGFEFVGEGGEVAGGEAEALAFDGDGVDGGLGHWRRSRRAAYSAGRPESGGRRRFGRLAAAGRG